MQDISPHTTSARKPERFLAVIGTAICLIVSALIWQVFSRQQPMWPLPDLYLLEMLAASFLGTWAVWNNDSKQSPLRGILIWAMVGVLFAFVIIGSFSIGFFFMPVAGLFAIAAILSGRRQAHNMIVHIGVGLAAALAQAALMLAAIRFLFLCIRSKEHHNTLCSQVCVPPGCINKPRTQHENHRENHHQPSIVLFRENLRLYFMGFIGVEFIGRVVDRRTSGREF